MNIRAVAAIWVLCALASASSVECIAGDVDDTARVIAGFPSGTSEFGQVEQGTWGPYTREIATYWNEYDRRIGRAMRRWACQELGRADGMTVFYPFSGPDLPTAVELYPDAERYILVSLQKGEPPPRLGRLSRREFESYLALFRKSWKFYGALGFFRTDDLDASAQGVRVGMTGPLMAFAVRLGFEIEAVEPIELAGVGSESGLRDAKPGAPGAWDSVRLILWRDGRRVVVEYVRMDLSNGSLGRELGGREWIERIAANPTILKAASHLPQDPDFTILRNAIVANAPSIVQDETGIEYGALAASFKVRLYGKFTRPNPSFPHDLQRSLAVAYQTRTAVKPLPFRLGYEKNAGSAMQIAVRDANAVLPPRKCTPSSAG